MFACLTSSISRQTFVKQLVVAGTAVVISWVARWWMPGISGASERKLRQKVTKGLSPPSPLCFVLLFFLPLCAPIGFLSGVECKITFT